MYYWVLSMGPLHGFWFPPQQLLKRLRRIIKGKYFANVENCSQCHSMTIPKQALKE